MHRGPTKTTITDDQRLTLAEREELLRSLGRLGRQLEASGIEPTHAATAFLDHGDVIGRLATHASWHGAFGSHAELTADELGRAARLAADWGEALARAAIDDALGDAVMWTLLHGRHAIACIGSVHTDSDVIHTPPAVADDRLCGHCRGIALAMASGTVVDPDPDLAAAEAAGRELMASAGISVSGGDGRTL